MFIEDYLSKYIELPNVEQESSLDPKLKKLRELISELREKVPKTSLVIIKKNEIKQEKQLVEEFKEKEREMYTIDEDNYPASDDEEYEPVKISKK